jgi:hypothetical protein
MGVSSLLGAGSAATRTGNVLTSASGTSVTIDSSASVLEAMRAAGVFSRLLALAIPVASTAVVNVPGIGDASANWVAIAGRLDGGVKTPMSDVFSKVRESWIADDSVAFTQAATVFQGDTEATRTFLSQIEKCLDDFGDSVRDYWIEIGAIVAMILVALLAWAALLVSPIAPWAKGIMEAIGGAAAAAIVTMTSVLGAFMAVAAGTLALGGKGMLQMYNLKPSGDATIDFSQAKIDWKPPTQWLEPTVQTPKPYGAGQGAPPATTPPPKTSTPPPATTTVPPKTTAPPRTSAPPTTAPPTTAPPTTAPPTSAPPTSAPPTSAPPTSAPPTTAPPTTAPPTSAPPTSAPPTSAPPTTAPPTTAPSTGAPTTAPPSPSPSVPVASVSA